MGHANDLRRMRMSKKLQSPTVVFYAAKDRQTIAGVRKRRQLLAGVVFSSVGISKKIIANVSRIPGRVLLVICSQTCFKSFVICAGSTQDVRDVRKIFVNPQPDHDSLQNVSRKKQRSSPDYFSTYSQTVRVLLLIRFTFATINLRMSQSIPELFPSYTQTKTDTFTNVWRRFCALTWPLANIKRVADVLFAF